MNWIIITLQFAGYEKIVDSLIRHGADVNHENGYGKTALHKAAEKGNSHILRRDKIFRSFMKTCCNHMITISVQNKEMLCSHCWRIKQTQVVLILWDVQHCTWQYLEVIQ